MNGKCSLEKCTDNSDDCLESVENRETGECFQTINDIEFIDEEECSILSDFVSAFSVDLLQETFYSAEVESPSEFSLDNLDTEQSDPFLVSHKGHSENSTNFDAEKTITTSNNSEVKKAGSAKFMFRMSLLQCMIIFLVMLFTLSITLVIVCSQVTLPGSSIRPQARPRMLSKDQVAILPNGNMVKMVGAKFMAPATQLQIVEHSRRLGQKSEH